jgi:ribosomal protein L19
LLSKEEVLVTQKLIRKMSGSVGVERIFPVNLPALQKLKSTKVQFVELEFSKRTYW